MSKSILFKIILGVFCVVIVVLVISQQSKSKQNSEIVEQTDSTTNSSLEEMSENGDQLISSIITTSNDNIITNDEKDELNKQAQQYITSSYDTIDDLKESNPEMSVLFDDNQLNDSQIKIAVLGLVITIATSENISLSNICSGSDMQTTALVLDRYSSDYFCVSNSDKFAIGAMLGEDPNSFICSSFTASDIANLESNTESDTVRNYEGTAGTNKSLFLNAKNTMMCPK